MSTIKNNFIALTIALGIGIAFPVKAKIVSPVKDKAAPAAVAPSVSASAMSPSPWEDSLLSHAFQLAFKGELTDAALIQKIETKFEHSEILPIRVFSAYLLTYAPRRTVKHKTSVYVEYVLGQSIAASVVGEQAVYRLYRMRGDEAFEEGQFDRAISDYGQILKSAQGFFREYAVLKTGWCYMNQEKPELAFGLWAKTVEAKLAKPGSGPSSNLLHGLGQAFAENAKRSQDDVAAIAKINFDPKQRQFVAEGIEDGLDFLKSDESIQLFAKQCNRLAWASDLTRLLFEKTQASGKRACQYLPFLNNVDTAKKLSYDSFGRLVESCSTWIVKSPEKNGNTTEITKMLNAVNERFELAGMQRRFRFEYLQFQGDAIHGCYEGMTWLAEKSDEKSRLASPIKETTELCAKAAGTEESTRKLLLHEIDVSAEKTHQLESENDPMVYLSSQLMKVAPMRAAMVSLMVAEPKRYRKTLLPTLLAERCHAEKDGKNADLLLATFAPKKISQGSEAPRLAEGPYVPREAKDAQMTASAKESAATQKKEAIWKQMLGQKIAGLLEAKKLAEALPSLEQYAPFEPDPSKLSSEGVRLWAVYLMKSKEDASLRAKVAPRLKKLLTVSSIEKSAEAAPVLLEMGGEFKQWENVWEIAKGLKAPKRLLQYASEKLSVDLFDAIISGQLIPKGWEAISDSELKFLVRLANDFKDKKFAEAIRLEPVGKSPISQDLKYVRTVSEKRNAALGRKRKKDLISEATVWVEFLDRNIKGIRQHAFVHPLFSKAAGTVVADFCRDAKTQIPGLAEKTAGDKDEIAQVVSALQERFSECSKGDKS